VEKGGIEMGSKIRKTERKENGKHKRRKAYKGKTEREVKGKRDVQERRLWVAAWCSG